MGENRRSRMRGPFDLTAVKPDEGRELGGDADHVLKDVGHLSGKWWEIHRWEEGRFFRRVETLNLRAEELTAKL